MPSGVYERTPEMKNGKGVHHSSEWNAAIQKGLKNSDAVKAHTGIPLSPEHCDSIRKALTGRTLSPEHCASLSEAGLGENNPMYGKHRTEKTCSKISEARRNSEAAKAQYESMCGGNDICDHHYIYDESDLSKYTIEMTRSHHTWIHNIFRKFDYIVPHINVRS